MQQEKVFDIRGRRMGGPTPLICSPLVARTPDRLASEAAAVLAKRPDVIEWRVDFFEKIAETTAVLASGRALRAAAGETPIIFTCRAAHEGGQPVGWTPPTDLTLDAVEREVILATLRRTGGNVKEAATILDIDRSTLYDRLRRYGIQR